MSIWKSLNISGRLLSSLKTNSDETWTIDEDHTSLFYCLRLQLRRPDGGTYNIESKISRYDTERQNVDVVQMHARDMRKRAKRDMQRERWDIPQTEPPPTAEREMYGIRPPNFDFEKNYRGIPIGNLQCFWRINEEISIHSETLTEPLDELRITVARWLT